MKILYVITKSEPYGGAQKYVYDMALAAKKNGHEVTVAAGLRGRLIDMLLKADIRVLPVESLQRDINVFKEMYVFFELALLFMRERPDIIHLNSSKAGGIGAFVARVCNLFIPKKDKLGITFTGHGWAFSEERPQWQKFVLYVLQVFTTYLSHVTIAVSLHNRRELLRHPLPFVRKKIERKLALIPNGIDGFETLSTREARKELIGMTKLSGSVDLWGTDTLWIGSIAELTKNKGMDRALKVLSSLEGEFRKEKVSFVFFIMGSGEDMPMLNRLIRNYSLESSVFLLGYVADARKYLKAFDIYFMPSRKEGLPYAFLEASYAGIPIVSTPVGGVPDVVNRPKKEFPETDEELAKEILYFAKNPQERLKYGAYLEKRVKNNFNADQMIKKTLALYNRFLPKNRV